MLALAVGSGGLGCRGGDPAGAPVPVDAADAIPHLLALVPDGVSWVAVARPRALLTDPATAQVAQALLQREGQTEVPAAQLPGPLGVPLGEVEELVLARYDEGTLTLLRGAFDAPAVVRERGEHMTGVEVRLDSPDAVRAGFLGTEEHYLRAVGRHVLLDASGGVGGPLSEALSWLDAFTAGGAPRSSASERLAALGSLHPEATLTLLVPRHLPVPDASEVGLLLAGQRALAVALRGSAPQVVELRATFLGTFPPGADANFRVWGASLATSELGRLTGMAEAMPTFSVGSGPGRMDVGIDLSATTLARGARLLLVAEIPEILADQTR